jgi:hypothetical protein
MAASRYSHRALSWLKEIRLLKIFPGEGNAKLQAELVHTPVEHLSDTDYEAISYTWGSGTFSHEIIIEQKPFYTTENVQKILTHLRRLDGPCIVWIDQICIDQTNLEEKGHQVRLMQDIYRLANEVLIWLGESDGYTEESFSFLQILLHDIQTTKEFDKLFEKYTRQNVVENEERFQRLGKILSHAWFTRVWIYQEVIVASKARILCGAHSMTWDMFAKALTALAETGLDQMLDRPSIGPRETSSNHRHVLQIQGLKERWSAGQEIELQKLMLASSPCAATDPKDRVFSFLGIATDAEDPELDPDYKQPISEVFHQTAAFLLCRDRKPYLLHGSGRTKSAECSNLPSWVPDLSVGAEVEVLGARSDIFSAARDTSARVRIGKSQKKLVVTGFILDTISERTSPCRMPPLGDDAQIEMDNDFIRALALWKLAWLKEASEMAFNQEDNPYEARGIETLAAFWRTLIANRTTEMETASDAYEAHYLNHLIYLQHMVQRGSLFNEDLEPQVDNITFVASGMFGGAMEAATGRRFAVTTMGYMALVPEKAEVGDHIAVFFGADTPFVIRRSIKADEDRDLTTVLLGESYVHGMMNGEIFDRGAQLLYEFVLV